MSAGVFVIAEAGVNHNGDVERARELIDVAAQCGADAVKFQTFVTDRLVTPHASKAPYQVDRTGGSSQSEMLRALELAEADHYALRDHAVAAGIEFMSTPFDLGSLAFLVDSGLVSRLKISSGDVTNFPLLVAAGRTRLPVIMSTGASTLAEVGAALGALAFGRREPLRAPEAGELDAWDDARIADPGAVEGISILHCTSDYPAPDDEVNLRAMSSIGQAFGVPVGLSDHTLGPQIPIAAVALGATIIEKHLTLSQDDEGPDHAASASPSEFAHLVACIRSVERALGDGIKAPTPSELRNQQVIRRGLYAARSLPAGHVLREEDIAILRPAGSTDTSRYWAYLGRPLIVELDAGEELPGE